MICIASPSPDWQTIFLRMLPAIRKHARIAVRHFDPDRREEAVQAVICNACCAIARLAELNKLDLAYASALSRFGVAQVRDGRMTGGSLNCRDISSRYCQRLTGVVVERLDQYDEEDNCWAEAVVEDTRNSPVPDTVAFRVDFADWLKSLKRRDRRIAQALSLGHTTGNVAKRFDVSAGRVSQLRRELAESWREFTGEGDNFSTAA